MNLYNLDNDIKQYYHLTLNKFVANNICAYCTTQTITPSVVQGENTVTTICER